MRKPVGKKRAVIYLIRNTKNGKGYVGVSTLKKPINRFRKHLHISRNKELYLKNHAFGVLHQAIVDDGEEHFTFEILEEVSVSKGFDRERFWIRFHQTFGIGGYNLTKGGRGFNGRTHSPETREKLSILNQGKIDGDKNPMFGRTQSPETKEKIAAGRRKARRGKYNPFYGKTHTDELKQRMREENLAREFKREWVEKRMKLSAEDVLEIKRLYEGGTRVVELAKKYEVSVPCIYKVLKKPRKIDQSE